MVKNLPAMRETWVRSLGQEDPWGRGWQPTQVFLPGEFRGHRSLAGYSPWDHEEQDTTERQTLTYLVCVQSPAIKHRIGFVEIFGALYNTDFVVAEFWSLFHLLASCWAIDSASK